MNRVQYKRGQKLPPNTKLVNRTSRWGNPYKVKEYGRDKAIYMYSIWLDKKLDENPDFLEPLRGFDLACDCALDKECHADILLTYLKYV